MDEQKMTNVEFFAFLETLAKTIEVSAKDAEDAAKIIE